MSVQCNGINSSFPRSLIPCSWHGKQSTMLTWPVQIKIRQGMQRISDGLNFATRMFTSLTYIEGQLINGCTSEKGLFICKAATLTLTQCDKVGHTELGATSWYSSQCSSQQRFDFLYVYCQSEATSWYLKRPNHNCSSHMNWKTALIQSQHTNRYNLL